MGSAARVFRPPASRASSTSRSPERFCVALAPHSAHGERNRSPWDLDAMKNASRPHTEVHKIISWLVTNVLDLICPLAAPLYSLIPLFAFLACSCGEFTV